MKVSEQSYKNEYIVRERRAMGEEDSTEYKSQIRRECSWDTKHTLKPESTI